MTQPTVYFYLPPEHFPDGITNTADAHQFLNYGGIHSWVLLTYLHLKADNFSCELTSSFPNQGIVLTHRDLLPKELKPARNTLLICIQAERGRHPFSQIHIVQNPHQALPQMMPRSDRYIFPGTSFYIPHWPQPGLIPRNSKRGNKFENIAFIGKSYNLAPELRSKEWQNSLKQLGLNWLVIENPEKWRNYTHIDAILAIRSFDGSTYPTKPASKLYNAWLAGVPAILGNDSAFSLERKSDLDYIHAATVKDAVNGIRKLQNSAELRTAIVENGKIRSQEIQSTALAKKWRYFLINIAFPAYYEWTYQSEYKRRFFVFARSIGLVIKSSTGTLET